MAEKKKKTSKKTKKPAGGVGPTVTPGRPVVPLESHVAGSKPGDGPVGIRLQFLYGSGEEEGDQLAELWVSGPAAAAGHVLDALTGADGAAKIVSSITVNPNIPLPNRLAQEV